MKPRTDPGIWTPISASDVANWRKAAYDRIGGGHPKVWESRGGGHVRGRGGSLERDVIRTVQTTPADHDGDTAQLVGDPRDRGIREARETIEIEAGDILAWIKADPEQYEMRVRHVVRKLREAGAIDHLTDDQAFDQVGDLAVRYGRMNAERAYAQGGYNRPVSLDGGV